MSNKNVYIIAGPNGSGKTTFAVKFLPEYAKCSNFVNADLIALGLSQSCSARGLLSDRPAGMVYNISTGSGHIGRIGGSARWMGAA